MVNDPIRKQIESCLRSDKKAQRALFESLAPKMMAVCLRYMGDRDSAQDVLQDGFVTLFSKLDSYNGSGSFDGWARRIFVNTALMALRKNDILSESDELAEAMDVGWQGPEAGSGIDYQMLLTMISELPAGFRTVFNMYVIEGYSHKEIADELGITEATSRSQLLRARGILQNKILKLNEKSR